MLRMVNIGVGELGWNEEEALLHDQEEKGGA